MNRYRSMIWGVALLAGCLFSIGFPSAVSAQSRSGASRWRQMQAAQRQQEINMLQQQIDNQKKVLESVTTQGTLTQAQLESARQAAMSARKDLNAIEDQNREINKKIREIEDKILESQSDDSAFAKALEELHHAQKEQDAELHRVLRRPPPDPNESEATRLSEIAKLKPDEREKLAADLKYQNKKAATQKAMDVLGTVKQTLFDADDEWKKAKEERHRIDQDMNEKKKSIRGSAADGSQARQELKSAEDVAASAKASIAQARMRLAELGASEKPQTPQKPTGNNGKKN